MRLNNDTTVVNWIIFKNVCLDITIALKIRLRHLVVNF
jgi:hypothetical protein